LFRESANSGNGGAILQGQLQGALESFVEGRNVPYLASLNGVACGLSINLNHGGRRCENNSSSSASVDQNINLLHNNFMPQHRHLEIDGISIIHRNSDGLFTALDSEGNIQRPLPSKVGAREGATVERASNNPLLASTISQYLRHRHTLQ
jgi:hypothetical protein